MSFTSIGELVHLSDGFGLFEVRTDPHDPVVGLVGDEEAAVGKGLDTFENFKLFRQADVLIPPFKISTILDFWDVTIDAWITQGKRC